MSSASFPVASPPRRRPLRTQMWTPRWRDHFVVRTVESAAQGLRQLAAHRVRTALALTGIVVGVAAVVGSMTLLEGVEGMVEATFERLGGTRMGRIWGKTGEFRNGRWIQFPIMRSPTAEDIRALPAGVPEVEISSPQAFARKNLEAGRQKVPGVMIWGNEPNYVRIRPTPMVAGRYFDEAEAARGDRVVVLLEQLALDLFGRTDIVGEEVRMSGQRFRVVGVARWIGGGRRRFAFVPFLTMRHRLDPSNEWVFGWYRLRDGATFAKSKHEILRFISARQPGSKPDDFEIGSPAERQERQLREIRTQGKILISVAMLCLVAGGVGILNVFLISVTERTREIGLRMALGASRKGVLFQFLFEAVALCSIGGAIGLAAAQGIAAAMAVAVRKSQTDGWVATESLSVALRPGGIALGLGLAFVTALVFGLYPAWRASRLDPTTALRSE